MALGLFGLAQIMKTKLTADCLKIGHTYQARRPTRCPRVMGIAMVNDRQIDWIDDRRTVVQYDSPSLQTGRQLPIVPVERFLKWASHDVTDRMPKGLAWRPWSSFAAERHEKKSG